MLETRMGKFQGSRIELLLFIHWLVWLKELLHHCPITGCFRPLLRTLRMMLLLLLSLSSVWSLPSRDLPPVGGERCTWGPDYWCDGFSQSRECETMNFCIDRVWPHRRLSLDNDQICSNCQSMIREARTTLESGQTQQELMSVLQKYCNLIPLPSIVAECQTLVQEYVPELTQMILSELNPQITCSIAGLCNSDRIDNLIAAQTRLNIKQRSVDDQQEISSSKSECELCKTESHKLFEVFRSTSKKQVEFKLLQLCGLLSTYSDACRATVHKNFDLFYSALSVMDSRMCNLIGMCSEGNTALVSSTSSEDVQCEFCERVTNHWVSLWTSDTTELEFKEVLDIICYRMQDSKQVQQCLDIAQAWYLPLFNYMANEMNSRQVCDLVGLCGQRDFLQVYRGARVSMLLSDNTASPDLAIAPAATPLTSSSSVLTSPGCAICEFVMKQLRNLIQDTTNEEQVNNAIDHVCEYVPSILRSQCDSLIDTYGSTLKRFLAEGLTAEEICEQIQLCVSSQTEMDIVDQQAALMPVELQVKRRNEDSCALCHFVMDTLFENLNSTDNERMVKNLLDSLCYRLPQSLDNECEKLVNEYTDLIVQMVLDNLDGDEICSGLQLCESPDANVVHPTAAVDAVDVSIVEEEEVEGKESCVLCEYVVSTLDRLVSDKHNEEEVRETLDKLCSYLPHSISHECVEFVNTYAETIINLITHDLTPDQLCQELQLCPQNDSDSDNDSDNDDHDERPYCVLCEYAIGEVDRLLEDKEDEAQIKAALDRICYELKTPVRKECLNMVNRYTDEIIALFVKGYTPQQVCAELGLCRRQSALSDVWMSNDVEVIPSPKSLGHWKGVSSSDRTLCVMCEFGVSVLEHEVLTNRSVDMVERGVQMLCSYLPQTVGEECEQFVDEYGDQIIHLIVSEEFAPQQICSQLQICNPRCVWGPAFWCQSVFHASVCGAIEHCRTNIWNN